MLAVIGCYTYISIETLVCREIVYNLNGNDPARTLIPPHNSANMSKKSV